MAKTKGMDCIVKIVSNLTSGTPIVLAGQRDGTLERSATEIDATSKDNVDGWTETLQGFKSWSVDCEAALIENDAGFLMLEDKFHAGEPVGVIVEFKSGTTYKGMASITSFPVNIPYDDLTTYSISLSGNGNLTKVEAV